MPIFYIDLLLFCVDRLTKGSGKPVCRRTQEIGYGVYLLYTDIPMYSSKPCVVSVQVLLSRVSRVGECTYPYTPYTTTDYYR